MTFEAAMRQSFERLIDARGDPIAMIHWHATEILHQHDRHVRAHLLRTLWAPSPSPSTGSSSATELTR